MPSRRRQFLTTAGSLSTVALAGCSSGLKRLSGGSGSGDSSELKAQKAVVDQFITGVNENDLDAVDESVASWAASGFTADNIEEYTFERGDLRRTSSDETGVLTIRHSGGGLVPAKGLAFHGTIVNPEGATPDISTDGTTLAEATQRSQLAPGDTVTVGVETEYDISVTYTKESVGDTVLLQTFSHS